MTDMNALAGLAVLDRSAGHRLGGVRPRGREPELAGPACPGGAGAIVERSRAGRARQGHPRPRVHLRQGEGLHRRRRRARVRAAAERARGRRQRHAASTPISTASSGMPVPVVCCIHGFCLGGGLELALACHWRIATRDDATRLGFPEVRLGIFPGFNGTARSIRQAGALAAMPLMLTGSMIRAGARAAWGSSTSWCRARSTCAGRRARPSSASASRSRRRCGRTSCAWAGARAARQEAAHRDRQEGARGALSGALPADRSVRDARRQPRGHEGRGDARLRAADGERHLAQSAPRVQAVGDDEGAGAQGPRLQAAARARDRRRRDGRRHRRLVRGLGHGGVAAGRERRADRQGHRRAEEAVQPQVQDQGAARRGQWRG